MGPLEVLLQGEGGISSWSDPSPSLELLPLREHVGPRLPLLAAGGDVDDDGFTSLSMFLIVSQSLMKRSLRINSAPEVVTPGSAIHIGGANIKL